MAAWLIPFTNKKKEILEAREIFQAGRVEEALEVYRKHAYAHGMVEAADHYLARNNVKRALELYKAAGHTPGIRSVLARHVEKGNFGEVQKTLTLLFPEEIPPTELATVGRQFLATGNTQGAERAMNAAGDRDGLRLLAGHFMDRGDHSNALRLYRSLGDATAIRGIAGVYLAKDDLVRAEKLYRECADDAGLVRVEARRAELAARAAAMALEPEEDAPPEEGGAGPEDDLPAPE